MDSDREHPSGQVPLPGAGGSGPADPGAAPLPPYGSGIRHARRMSNWTAAALIVGTGAVTASVVPLILQMAYELGLMVVVEGIETSEQAEYFRNAGSGILAQGWLFGQPVPAAQMKWLVQGGVS